MFFKKTYSVFVDDNFHYMDEDERYHLGDFADYAAALAACKKRVDDYLASAFKPDMTAAKLFESYTSFGDDPWIKSKPFRSPRFSAWNYAKQRCQDMCAQADQPSQQKKETQEHASRSTRPQGEGA